MVPVPFVGVFGFESVPTLRSRTLPPLNHHYLPMEFPWGQAHFITAKHQIYDLGYIYKLGYRALNIPVIGRFVK